MDRIRSVETWECKLPLPRTLTLGQREIRARGYQVLRISLDSGVEGVSIGYTRDLPITDLLRPVVEFCRDLDVSDPPSVAQRFGEAMSQTWTELIRGFSLVDVALWDAAALTAGMPVGDRLVAGAGQLENMHRGKVMLPQPRASTAFRPPVWAVCGYYSATRDLDDVLEEVLTACALGHRGVKVVAPSSDPADLERFYGAVVDAVPNGVGVAAELYNLFPSATSSAAALTAIDGLGLDFIEDLYPVGSWRQYAATDSRTPLAAGEDSAGPREWHDLVFPGRIRVLRADVTASGGYSAAMSALAVVGADRVIPHVFTRAHGHLARSGLVDAVEVTSSRFAMDPIDTLAPGGIELDPEGRLMPTYAPGIGLIFDWDAVKAHAVRYEKW